MERARKRSCYIQRSLTGLSGPFFWSCFIALILERVATQSTWDWMQRHWTFYADDGRVSFLFTSEQMFETGLYRPGLVISTGPNPRCFSPYMAKTSSNCGANTSSRSSPTKRLVSFPGPNNSLYEIPLQEQQLYLGVTMTRKVANVCGVLPSAHYGLDAVGVEHPPLQQTVA